MSAIAASDGSWFLVSSVGRRLVRRPCLHFESHFDRDSGNYHMTTYGHYPVKACTTPADKKPPEVES